MFFNGRKSEKRGFISSRGRRGGESGELFVLSVQSVPVHVPGVEELEGDAVVEEDQVDEEELPLRLHRVEPLIAHVLQDLPYIRDPLFGVDVVFADVQHHLKSQ